MDGYRVVLWTGTAQYAAPYTALRRRRDHKKRGEIEISLYSSVRLAEEVYMLGHAPR
jgi:hypothetical protein